MASAPRSLWPEFAVSVVTAIGVTATAVLGRWETIPFHLVWVNFALIYGWRAWRLGPTLAALALVATATSLALAASIASGDQDWDEMAEVPLMTAMFLAMVWHTRRRQAATEELRRATERERELVRDVSHELRTPVTIARGHLELLRGACAGQGVESDIDVVLDELARLSRTSDHFLLLAASGHPDFLRREPVELEWLVNAAARRWGAAAPRRWRVTVADELIVTGDEDRLAAALDALIENAVKFTGEGDDISVTLRAAEHKALIEVSDSGSGIAPADLSMIFERFARSEQDGGGTGLGLAIVKAIAKAHGGDVSAASTPGAGTTVTIALPGIEPGR